ncbi:phosphoadenylyl-sulfate reductase [Tuberibacillus sp. Marseille-P3662]|uniref:phosphoadenylyl-sulfate reductase n=1 Tax=Tuberibacillus sp. Marseille-P3662 TaxID=1965358 RepID=UPI000A1C9A4B|nr:phosphoadenylyl-sulfate reductase [Tuberibacillus sp. Marseille-P3662]
MDASAVTYENFSGDPFSNLSTEDETKGAIKVLDWAYNAYGDDIVYACSFGAEGIVLIDLISKVKPDAELVFLDTGVHFDETYELIDRIQARFPELQITMQKPDLTLDQQADRYGPELWNHNPDQCCFIRKIKPLEKALSGAPAWISGLRREQSASRKNTDFVNKDNRFRSVKVCPIIHWSWDDVWDYIEANDLPYNELHDQGYPSIGCQPCTFQANDANDSRSGRWRGFGKTECGLHTVSNENA